MKLLTLTGSAVTLSCRSIFARAENFDKFEFPVLVLLATLGMMLMISANDMIALYLGLELQIAGALRGRRHSTATICARPRPA